MTMAMAAVASAVLIVTVPIVDAWVVVGGISRGVNHGSWPIDHHGLLINDLWLLINNLRGLVNNLRLMVNNLRL